MMHHGVAGPGHLPAHTSIIALQDVTKTHDAGAAEVRALRGVSLDVRRGEWLAIMGPSGGGKSTLLHIIGCLDLPTSGSYVLNGQDVSALSDDALADVRNERIGFVFQTFNLLPRVPALAQVMLPLEYRRAGALPRADQAERARRALTQVNLADRMRHLPSQLSGGERQRVAIARALVNQPSLLLADEPTGNLDTRSGTEVLDIIAQLHSDQGVTIVMVTHDPTVAARAQRTVAIRDGLLVEGTPA